MKPRVTVLMAAYNGEAYVRQAVDSVLRQSVDAFKLLIVDDASTDRTAEVIARFDDPRIQYVRNERNMGLAASLNRGLDMIDTEFAARMDCDDTCHPQRLAWQLAFMDEHPECGLSGTWLRTFGLRGQRGLSRYPASANDVRVSQLFGSPVAHATLIMRMDRLNEHRLRYNPDFTRTEDFDFVTRATDCFPVLNLERCTYYYRRHAECATIRGEDIMIRELTRIVQRQFDSLGLAPSARELDLHCRTCVGRGFESEDEILVADTWFEELRLRLVDRAVADTHVVERCLARQWFLLCRNSTRLGFSVLMALRRPAFAGRYVPPVGEASLLWTGVGRHALQGRSRRAAIETRRAPPLVSVLMPMRDASKFLREAVGSIVSQTYPHFEFIVVDDASKDDSLQIVESFKDARIRILRNVEGQGVAASLNRAVAEARGKYLARMDADDISLPTRFEKQVAYLEGHPTVAVVGSRVAFIGGPWGMADLRPVYPAASAAYLIFGTPLAHPTVMIRREAFDAGKLGYRSEFSRTEDFDLWTRLVAYGSLTNLPDVLLRYRLHSQSVSCLHHDTMAQQEQDIIRRQLTVRGYALNDADFLLFRRIAKCQRFESLQELDSAQALLLRLVESDKISPSAMRYAASVAWLRLCCNCGTLGTGVWRRYRESELRSNVPGGWMAERGLLASCILHACMRVFRS